MSVALLEEKKHKGKGGGGNVISTSFFHHEADVIGQVALFIILTALSPLTLLHFIIIGAASVVISLSVGCVSVRYMDKKQKRKTECQFEKCPFFHRI